MERSYREKIYLFALFVMLSGAAFGQNVLTGGNDNYRTNANLAETILTPAKVKSSSFGPLFTLAVDGQIYAQPLCQKNLTLADGSTHDVVFVATMHNSVYAFDADKPGLPLWTVNLGPSVPTSNYASDEGAYSDILPENGILGTPVIDPNTGTLYAVAATFEFGKFQYRLHALDTASGAEKFGAPVTISARVTGLGDASINGWVLFDAGQHLQRPALLLSNGVVYVAFGSHGDAAPYHGWVLSYNAFNVQAQLAVFNASPNGGEGAVWQSGRGPAADDAGNIYVVTSNGSTDFSGNFSDSVLKLDPSQLSIADWFAPFNFQFLSDTDDDLGSAGALLIPVTNFVVTGGKQGKLYLLNGSQLGNTAPNDSQIAQSLNLGGFGLFNMALWNRADGPILYTHIANAPVAAYRLSGNQFPAKPTAQALSGFSVPFQGMELSANGGQPGTGILWVTAANTWPLPGPGVLHAYNADDLSEIFTDNYGTFTKFANPTVAGGRVFVPTMDNQLVVYGVKYNTVATPIVTGIVNAASYTGGAISPGEMVAIYGQNMGPQTLAVAGLNSYGNIGTQLKGTTVTFNGIPGPVLYTSAGAVAAVVPYGLAGAASAAVAVSYYGQESSLQTVPVKASTPGIFSADAEFDTPVWPTSIL